MIARSSSARQNRLEQRKVTVLAPHNVPVSLGSEDEVQHRAVGSPDLPRDRVHSGVGQGRGEEWSRAKQVELTKNSGERRKPRCLGQQDVQAPGGQERIPWLTGNGAPEPVGSVAPEPGHCAEDVTVHERRIPRILTLSTTVPIWTNDRLTLSTQSQLAPSSQGLSPRVRASCSNRRSGSPQTRSTSCRETMMFVV